MITKRIEQLRSISLNTPPSISEERGVLMTRFYKSDEAKGLSVPMLRAKALYYLMSNKTIYIGDGELIIGERGPSPQQTPTYPEVCIHSIKDLQIVDERPKVRFSVSQETKKVFGEQLIPYWTGKSQRDKIFDVLSQEWKNAYAAGIFTEFLEQRAPGHTVLGDVIYREGFIDIQKRINKELDQIDFYQDAKALDKQEELQAMLVSLDAIIIFAKRHIEKLQIIKAKESDSQRIAELEKMIEVSKNVPQNKPQNIWEALQYYWYVHQGVITELNPWDSFNPGRLDQHLMPFYQKALEENLFSTAFMRELLQSFWVKFNNHPSPPKTGVTAKESNTFTDFSLINLGGLKADGSNAVNDMSYLLLDIIEEMRILQPSSMIQLSKKNPDRFIKRALKVVKTGFGQPSIFNTDAIIQELLNQGKNIKDARNGGASGCIETGAFGTEAYILTGYFNLPKILEVTLNNGFDPLTQKQLGPKTGDISSFINFEILFQAWKTQLNHFVDLKIKGNNIIEAMWAKYMPAPFLSVFIDDCISNGIDYNAGGARYNTSYIQGVGLGSITDSLSALKYWVFEKKELSINDLNVLLKTDFEDAEAFRQKILIETPKYGNDDDRADDLMKDVFESFYQAVNGRPTARGGVFRINLLPTTSHVYFGGLIGALPDGRKAKMPLSEGISPFQGADRNGPTSVIKSASKIDHLRTGGTLLNLKLNPALLEDEVGEEQIKNLIRTYFKLDGHHVQFNVVTAETLKEAKKKPLENRDLIVRVAGYSDYFIELTDELQDEIIRRTEHSDM